MKRSFGRVVNSFFIRHSEELQIVLALVFIAFCLWLGWKMWRNRARIGDFVRWFLGMQKSDNALPGRVREQHGIVVLFFDIFALCLSLIATAIVCGIVLSPPAILFSHTVRDMAYSGVRAMGCDQDWLNRAYQTDECQNALQSASSTLSQIEIAAGTLAWLFGILTFLFLTPRIFRLIHRRYLK